MLLKRSKEKKTGSICLENGCLLKEGLQSNLSAKFRTTTSLIFSSLSFQNN